MVETVDRNDDLERLRRDVAALSAEVERLRAEQVPDGSRSSRRQMIARGAAALGAGFVGSMAVAGRTSADNGDPIVVAGSHTGTGSTKVTSSGVGADALYGLASATSGPSWGVRGESNSVVGAGVRGRASSPTGATTGVWGTVDSSTGTGVLGECTATTGNGVGIKGVSSATNGFGVHGVAMSGAGNGVFAESTWSAALFGRAAQDGPGVVGWSDGVEGVGGVFNGQLGGVLIHPSGPGPTSTAVFQTAGLLYLDTNADLWLCVADGTPGRWRKVSGANTAGSIHAIAPVRAYDSRFGGGRIGAGQNRVVAIRDAIDVTTGAVTTKNAIPSGATSVFYNVTCVGTTAAGWLSVQPGDASKVTAASINWSASGQTLANASIVKLDAARRVKVFAGGAAGAACDVVIDVTGYTL